jgi:hypothetical protein
MSLSESQRHLLCRGEVVADRGRPSIRHPPSQIKSQFTPDEAMKRSVLLGLCILGSAAATQAQTRTRPISDWVNAQTTLFWWYEPDDGNAIFLDYTGRYNAWLVANGYPDLGTTVSGSVTERPLKGGGTHVHVVLHVDNTFAYAWNLNQPGLWLGNALGAVLGGAEPAIGACNFVLDWDTTSAPGTETLDFIQVVGGASVMFNASCTGVFNAASPYAAGTPGEASTTQRGIAGKNQGKWATDGYATEFVRIHPLAP